VKLDNVLQEMGCSNIDILDLYETRWTDSGTIRKDDCTHWALSDRVLLVKIIGNPFNISFIQAIQANAVDLLSSF